VPRSTLTERLPALALLLVTGAVATYFASRAGGTGAGVLAATALACALGLVLRIEPISMEAPSAGRLFDAVLLAVPGALTIFLSFGNGGYFPETPALAAILLVLVLVLRLILVDEPFAGFSWPLAGAAAALGLYALWILLSATWSDAPARALIDFDRTLLYLLALVLFGSIPRTSGRLVWMARGLALAIVLVAAAALATRFFPDTFPTFRNLGNEQLSYPLTYSNALGILCVFGAILCLHFTSTLREPRAVRALAAAALPALLTTLYLTLSRGPVFAAAGGLLVYVMLGRPRGLVTGLVATVPACVVAVATAYQNELLTSADPTTPAAISQGEHVAVIVALCSLVAGVLRLVLAPLDTRLRRFSLPSRLRLPVIASAWAIMVVVVLVIGIATGAPGFIADRYEGFVDTAQPDPNRDADIRESVLETGNRGLIDNWDIALEAFRSDRLHGQGAGAYEAFWTKERPADQGSYDVNDAHSLYLEVLGELGLVGFVLLLVFLVAILVSLAPLRRARNRSLYAALFAVALTWAAHAGVEWDWEVPAVTAWLFALGGASLASHEGSVAPTLPRGAVRAAVGILVLGAAVAPGLVLVSQRHLDDSVDAFYRRDCREAIDRAAASISTLAVRPEPYEVIAVCQGRLGSHRLAVQAMEGAVEREPRNWRYRYGLAIARGAAGLDPRPAILIAERLNPLKEDIRGLSRELGRGSKRDWRRLTTPLAREARPTVFR
jgi:hypothetical protein